jgi:hypothetical protein
MTGMVLPLESSVPMAQRVLLGGGPTRGGGGPSGGANNNKLPIQLGVFCFLPLKMCENYPAEKNDDCEVADGVGMFKLVNGPPSCMTFKSGTGVTYTSNVTEYGLSNGYDADEKSLEFSLSQMCSRANTLGVITAYNQGFLLDIRKYFSASNSGERHPGGQNPIRMELDIRQQANSTSILVADVSIMVRSKRTRKGRVEVIEEDFNGYHSLCFFGDSDGKINYCLCDRESSIHTDSFQAHNSPVVAIISTGDASRPIWRVGSKMIEGKKEVRILPQPSPGSAIISLAKNGEVKVWQPVFTDMKGVASKKELLFNVCGLSWRLSGTFTCRVAQSVTMPSAATSQPSSSHSHSHHSKGKGHHGHSHGHNGSASGSNNPNHNREPVMISKIGGQAVSAFLDPACMTVGVCFNDGSIEQWPIPGLVEGTHRSLVVLRDKLWGMRRHMESVTDARIYVHQTNSGLQLLPEVDKDKLLLEDKKVDLNPVVAKIEVEGQRTLGYKFLDLRARAEASSLVTSSKDLSILLWKFSISNREHIPIKYLQPIPVRRFVFSSVPSCGLCFSPSPTSTAPAMSVWRVSVSVNGVVVTATQGTRAECFKMNTELLQDTAFTKALTKALATPPGE